MMKDGFNSRRGETEESVVKGADVVLKRIEETADQLRQDFQVADDGVDVLETLGLRFLKPYLRMLQMWLGACRQPDNADPALSGSSS